MNHTDPTDATNPNEILAQRASQATLRSPPSTKDGLDQRVCKPKASTKARQPRRGPDPLHLPEAQRSTHIMSAALMSRNRANEGTSAKRYLTIEDVCGDLEISRSTFYDWKAKGKGPRCIRLPNGSIRIRWTEYLSWLQTLEVER
jgi:predicted DNA-binding transcriptional regulator AlpA